MSAVENYPTRYRAATKIHALSAGGAGVILNSVASERLRFIIGEI